MTKLISLTVVMLIVSMGAVNTFAQESGVKKNEVTKSEIEIKKPIVLSSEFKYFVTYQQSGMTEGIRLYEVVDGKIVLQDVVEVSSNVFKGHVDVEHREIKVKD